MYRIFTQKKAATPGHRDFTSRNFNLEIYAAEKRIKALQNRRVLLKLMEPENLQKLRALDAAIARERGRLREANAKELDSRVAEIMRKINAIPHPFT